MEIWRSRQQPMLKARWGRLLYPWIILYMWDVRLSWAARHRGYNQRPPNEMKTSPLCWLYGMKSLRSHRWVSGLSSWGHVWAVPIVSLKDQLLDTSSVGHLRETANPQRNVTRAEDSVLPVTPLLRLLPYIAWALRDSLVSLSLSLSLPPFIPRTRHQSWQFAMAVVQQRGAAVESPIYPDFIPAS